MSSGEKLVNLKVIKLLEHKTRVNLGETRHLSLPINYLNHTVGKIENHLFSFLKKVKPQKTFNGAFRGKIMTNNVKVLQRKP